MNKGVFASLNRLLEKHNYIPTDQWEKFKSIFSVLHLQKEEHFIRAGEKPSKIGFAASGVLRLYYISEAGTEFNKSFCLADDFVASYSALLTNSESRLSIQALEDATLLTAKFADFLELLDNHVCWQIISRKIAEDLYIKKEKRECEFLLDDAETRYLRFLKEYPGLDTRIKQYHIASYLGITPVAISRIRAKLGLTD